MKNGETLVGYVCVSSVPDNEVTTPEAVKNTALNKSIARDAERSVKTKELLVFA